MIKSLVSLRFSLLALTAFSLLSCYDPANQIAHGGVLDRQALREKQQVKHLEDFPLNKPGKIYVKGNLLYVNEQQKGLHIFDNTNPAAPKKQGFIQIPGNIDIAMKDEALYADSYMDLLVINTQTKETTRIKDVFNYFPEAGNTDGQGRIIAQGGSGLSNPSLQAVSNGSPTGASTGGQGTAGSMSRFAIVGKTLYVLDGQKMKVFNIEKHYAPKLLSEIKMDFQVETIFPYEDKLFIGGVAGMYVYDNSNPQNPQFLGQVQHLVACDPVVVEGNTAYITLRGGSPCRGAENNELLLVDVSDPTKMEIKHSFPMHNPHGLAIKNNLLYICDGNQGLKVFDTRDQTDILGNIVAKDADLRKAYDVIALDDVPVIIVVGRDGIFQYDVANPAQMRRLSQIPLESVG